MDYVTEIIGSGRLLWVFLGFLSCFLSIVGSIETQWIKINLSSWRRQLAMFGLGIVLIAISFIEPFISDLADSSEYNISGSWEIVLVREDTSRRDGLTSIQHVGKSYFQATGTVESTTTPPSMTFCIECVVRNGELFGVFKNARNEFGVVTGFLVGKSPRKFSLVYRDVQDTNADPKGILEFTKVTSNE